MAATGFDAPAEFAPEDELPIAQTPDVPLWSENYHKQVYDAGAGVGVLMHLGRTPYDVSLWRQLVVVYLPDDDVVVDKSYGRAPANGPGASTLTFDCEE